MDLLHAPLTVEQTRLLVSARNHFETHASWPTWLWLRRAADVSNSVHALTTLPVLRTQTAWRGVVYGLVWVEGASVAVPDQATTYIPDSAIVGLSVLGWHRSGAYSDEIGTFLAALSAAVQQVRDFVPGVGESEFPPLTSVQLKSLLGRAPLYSLLAHEPPFWVGRSIGADGEYTLRIDDGIEVFSSAVSVETYETAIQSWLDGGAGPNSPPDGARRARFALTRTLPYAGRAAYWLAAAVLAGVAAAISGVAEAWVKAALELFGN